MRQFRRDIERIGRQSRCTISAAFFAGAIAMGCGSTAFAQCQYEVTAIITSPPCPFGGTSPLIGSGLNENGEVVGHYAACPGCGTECWDSAFFWSAETGLITLPKPDGVTIMRASSINDHQQIAGELLFSGVGWRGFMYDMKSGEFQFLEPAIASGQAYANAINNAGIVAGARSTKETGPSNYNAVIWDTNTGEVIDLGTMGIGPRSVGSDTDEETDEIVGWTGQSIASNSRAVVQSLKKFIVLDPVPGTHTSHASYRNRTRVVTGTGANTIDFVWRGFIWMEEFDVLDPPAGFNSSGGSAINDLDQILVLFSVIGGVQRPYLWQHGKAVDLNELKTSGPLLTSPSDINNNGQILVRAATTAVLLTPIDVPLADLNYDCKVDGHDLAILLNSWGPQPIARGSRGAQTHPADLNGDGVVDGADLLILLANWNP